MKPLSRVAFIGNHLPRRCGIATFTHDLHRAVAMARPGLETCVAAMNDPGGTYDYPAAVRFQLQEEAIDAYADAADALNAARFEVVSLQHEYGIFGGCRSASNPDPPKARAAPSLAAVRCAARLQPWRRDVTT